MKFFFLFVLFSLVACDGGGNRTSKVTVGGVANEQYANEYIKQSTDTLPPELKITDGDKIYLESELSLTAEEQQTLNQL